jgi:glycosyltransferase involved in cell wall biosynthesis
MPDTAILSTYPVSASFREDLARRYGDGAQYLVLLDLRRRSFPEFVRLLRGLAPRRLVLAQEDEASASVVPVLHLVAAATRSHAIEVFGPDRVARPLSRLGALRAALGLVGGTAHGLLAIGRANRAATRLLRADPRTFPAVRKGSVLYLNTNLWFGIKAGGSVGHTAGVINGFQRLGWPVWYASIGGSQMVDPEVKVLPLSPPAIYGFPSEVNHYRFHESVMRQLGPVVERERPSLIYQRMSLGNSTGVALSRRFDVPLVLEYNGGSAWMSRNWGRGMRFESLASRLEEVCLRHAHRVLTVSQVLADEVTARGVPRERVLWYPNCVDERIFDPALFPPPVIRQRREQLAIEPDAVAVTFVGTFGRWHGVEVLARAAAHLVATDRAWLDRYRVRFIFVGDGPLMSEVRSALADPACASYVRLTGLVAQQDAPGYLAASDILASPHVPNPDGSPFFGSPTKLFEYMAMGRAIIASRLDQIEQVLSPALDAAELPRLGAGSEVAARAVLVPPGDVQRLVDGLRFLVERPEWRGLLGANARCAARERFLWRHHVEHLLSGLPVAVE